MDEVVVPVYVEDVSTMNITTTNIPMASPVTTTTKSKRKANEDLIDNASAAKKKRKTKGAGDDGNDTPSSKSKSRSKGDKETAVPSGSTGNEVVSLDQAAKNLKAVRKADKLRKKQSEKLYELQQKEQSECIIYSSLDYVTLKLTLITNTHTQVKPRLIDYYVFV